MNKLFWMIFLVGAYVWLVTTGREDILIDTGKAVYKAIVTWFEDAEVDLHMQKDEPKKRSRRWE